MLAMTSVLALSMAGCGSEESGDAAAPVRYVALGDSYSSGTGTGTARGVCQRSSDAFPALLAKELPGSTLTFAACAGATAADVISKQLDALSSSTSLVTLTVGGNDTQLLSLIALCATTAGSECRDGAKGADRAIADKLPAQLDTILVQIRSRSPRAQVIVVGYPALFAARSCPSAGGIDDDDRSVLDATGELLDQTLEQHARAAGARYASTVRRFEGHGICAARPWITGQRAAADALHPTITGHRDGLLAAVRDALER